MGSECLGENEDLFLSDGQVRRRSIMRSISVGSGVLGTEDSCVGNMTSSGPGLFDGGGDSRGRHMARKGRWLSLELEARGGGDGGAFHWSG